MPQHERGDHLGPVRQVHFGGTLTASSATPPAVCPGNGQGDGCADPGGTPKFTAAVGHSGLLAEWRRAMCRLRGEPGVVRGGQPAADARRREAGWTPLRSANGPRRRASR
jgi:hypothetical protein